VATCRVQHDTEEGEEESSVCAYAHHEQTVARVTVGQTTEYDAASGYGYTMRRRRKRKRRVHAGSI